MIQKVFAGTGLVQHGDCLDLMPLLPAHGINLILCDLPYGTTMCRWDSVIDPARLWEQYKRLLTPDGAVVLTATQPFTTTLIQSNREWYKYEWIWVKSRSGGFMNAKNMPLTKHEHVLVFSPGTTSNGSKNRMKYNPQGLIALNKTVRGRSNNKEKDSEGHHYGRASHKAEVFQEFTGYPTSILEFASAGKPIHPTQKPVDMFEYLIRAYTNENEVVLDNCSGSGTTAIAAIKAGRRFICMEKEQSYFEASITRIEQYYADSPQG